MPQGKESNGTGYRLEDRNLHEECEETLLRRLRCLLDNLLRLFVQLGLLVGFGITIQCSLAFTEHFFQS